MVEMSIFKHQSTEEVWEENNQRIVIVNVLKV